MSLGLCCQYIESVQKKSGKIEYKNLCNEKHLQYGRFLKNGYSNQEIQKVWQSNVENVFSIIKRIQKEGIRCFRISSGLIPLYDCAESLLKEDEKLLSSLQEIGDFVKLHKMRLTQHPDQFCVISSNTPDVIRKSITILNHHAWIFDKMGLDQSPYYAINIHGGTKGNKDRLIETINLLSENVKSRLTLENDERSYSVIDLYEVFQKTGIPVVFDSHHASFNNPLPSLQEGFELAKTTWKNVRQLTHLSNTEPSLSNGNFTERRKHSDFIHFIPEYQRLANNNDECDIEVEAKMKNLCIFKMVKDFDIKL